MLVEARRRKPEFREAELLTHFKNFLPALLRKGPSPYWIGTEILAGRTIADLVILSAPAANWARIPREPLSTLESVIMATLRRGGPLPLAELEAHCGLKPGSIIATDLVRKAMVRIDRAGKVHPVSQWAKALRVTAYEAKLLKWRQALHQAEAYRQFADESYVVLPKDFAKQALRARAEFVAAGVGLVVVDAQSISRVILPRRAYNHDWSREYVCSRLRVGMRI